MYSLEDNTILESRNRFLIRHHCCPSEKFMHYISKTLKLGKFLFGEKSQGYSYVEQFHSKIAISVKRIATFYEEKELFLAL